LNPKPNPLIILKSGEKAPSKIREFCDKNVRFSRTARWLPARHSGNLPSAQIEGATIRSRVPEEWRQNNRL